MNGIKGGYCHFWLLTAIVCANAGAQDRADIAQTLSGLEGGGTPRLGHAAGGDLSYFGAPAGGGIATGHAGSPAEAARDFLLDNGSSFGIRAAGVDFQVLKENPGVGRTYVRLQQTLQGIPVFAGEAIVQVGKGNRIESASADIARRLGGLASGRVPLTPSLDAEAAVAAARKVAFDLVGGQDFRAVEAPELVIYDPEVVGEDGSATLAWLFTLQAALPGVFKTRFLVDAHSGDIAFHYTLIMDAKNRQIYDSNNTSADPGTLRRPEGGAVSSISDVNDAYDYYGHTYDFYLSNHGRDSIDDAGFVLSATTRYCDPLDICPYANAFWDGSRMYFGEGFAAADDVVAHELTHGVTQYTSDLIYANQSGALNESFSDVWGEFVDQVNGQGTDTPAVKWLMGEDVPGFGAIRNMKDPGQFGDPDRTCSPNYYLGGADGGGVHSNSGVSNKLCYLLTDGDTFNGHTVTGMGIPTVADLYYEVQTNLLTAASNYLDFYNAMTQAAINIGLNPAQQLNVEEACQAVEITDTTSCVLPPPPPANDDCANAIAMTLDQNYTGTLGGATGNAPRTCDGLPLFDVNDVWYTFSPPTTGLYTVSLCNGTTADTTLFILTGSCAVNAEVACDDESCGPVGFGVPSEIVQTLNQGTTYLVRVAGWNGSGGNYTLVVRSGDTGEGEGEGEGETCETSTSGTLDNFSLRWDRRYNVSTNLACNASSSDWFEDDMAYEAIAFHAETNGNLVASMSFFGTSIGDPTLSLYCDPFNPAQPAQNLIAFNDDYNFLLSGFDNSDGIALTTGNTYWLVVSTYNGSLNGQLLDSGDYELCLGTGFAFGPAGSVVNDCSLVTCPPFDAQGSGLYTYIGGLLSSSVVYATDDLDAGGIPDQFEVALAEEVLCHGGVPWNEDALCTYQDNLATLEAETGYAPLQPYADILGALLSTGPGMRSTLATTLSLGGTYESAAGGAKSGNDPLAPEGDPDQDGYTNLEEYLNVLADGGTEADYVLAALNPLLDGSAASVAALPVAGGLGAALLLGTLAPSAVIALRRRKNS